MTFDEAQQLLLDNVTDEEARPLVVYVMSVLKDTYVPTVEMTQAQYDELLGFKHKFGSSHLAGAIHQGSNGTWSFLDELSGRIFGHGIGETTDKNIETIMQAWLHPETIKVVNEFIERGE